MAKDVKVQIVGDATKYKAALADAGHASDKFSGQTKKNGDEMSKFGLGALAVGAAVGVGLFKAGEAASNLGESVNAVRVTFGKSADGILKLGEDAATAVGLSNTAFNGLAVQFSSFATTIAGKGGDVVGTMSDMTTRAADFASVMNIDVAEAARLFQSGLAGETEPLKKFGIDLSAAAVKAYAAANGIGTLGKELTESEKVTARYGLLMESTAKTQGDFANTSDSAANATRIAKAEMENAAASLGAVVAPIIATVATKVADLAKGFVGLNDATGGALLTITAMAGGMAVLLGATASVVGRFQKMAGAFHTADGGLNTLGRAGQKAAGPLAILTVVAVGLTLRAGHAADALKRITENAEELSSVADKDVLNVLNMSLAQGVANGVSLEETMKTLAATNLEGAKRALELAEANGTNKDVVFALRVAILEEERAVAQGAKTTAEFADATGDATGATEGLTIAQAAAKGAIDEATAAVDRNKKHNEDLVKAVERGLDDIERKWDELTGTIDANESWANLQLDFMELKTKGEEALTALKDGTEDARTKALEYQIAVDQNKKSIIDYAQEVLKIPPERITNILAAVDAGDLERAELLLANLTRNRNMSISIEDKSGAGYGVTLTGKHAKGGRIPMGEGLSLVGEQGPELISSPGSTVYPAGQTAAMLNGNGGTGPSIGEIHIHVQSMPSPNELISIVKRYEARNGSGWRS